MKKILFLLLISSTAFAQQDSLIIYNTFDYDLNYGISFKHRFCSNQMSYSKSNTLLREINYEKDSVSSKVHITNYINYFYTETGKISSAEKYNSADEVLEVFKYTYHDNLLSTKEKLTTSNNKLTVSETIEYRYSGNELTQEIHKNVKKKKFKITSYSYQADKKVITETYTKHAPKTINYNTVKTIEVYSNSNIIKSTRLEYKNEELISDSLITVYSYKDNLLKEELNYINSEYQGKKTYDYHPQSTKPIKISVFGKVNNKPIKVQTTNIEREIINYQERKSVLE